MIPQRLFTYLLLLSLFIFSTCEDKTEAESIPLLTVSIDPSYGTSETDNWIIVHDEDGSVLDYKSFEAGNQFVMNSSNSKGSTIGVTVLRYTPSGTNKYYNVYSYLAVDKGRTLKLNSSKRPLTTPGNVIGNFDVKFQFPSMDQFSITDKLSYSCGGSGTNGMLNFQCSIIEGAEDHLLQASGSSGKPLYKMLRNVKDGDKYNLSANDLIEFDKNVEFNFGKSGELYCMVLALQPNGAIGHLLNYHWSTDQHDKYTIGYLNELTNYSTSLKVSYSDYSLNYNNGESIPTTDFSWPLRNNFTLVSKSINDFSSTASQAFKYRSGSWSYQENTPTSITRVYWNVLSSSTNHKLQALPQEIISQHPALAFDKLQHDNSNFTTVGPTYGDLISTMFESGNLNGANVSISLW